MSINIAPPGTLMQIQSTVAHFTQLLHKVLNLEVEVIDNHFIRIAGSGIYGQNIGAIPESNTRLLRSVIESKKEKRVLHSRADPLCRDCHQRKSCKELGFIGVPILHNGLCLGAISLIAIDRDQHQRLCDNSLMFIQYIKHISTLLINNLFKQNIHPGVDNDLFHRLMNTMDQGVMVLDTNNRVLLCNDHALRILDVGKKQLTGQQVTLHPLTCANKEAPGYIQYSVKWLNHQRVITGHIQTINQQQLFLFAFHQSHIVSQEHPAIDEPRIEQVIGESRQIKAVKRLISLVANSPSSIMITGESGTGKEVVAKAIHRLSPRSAGPFIAINCAAIPENLLESELFGYAKGAFTGAAPGGKNGLIQSANGGTLFLDEIGDMPLILQAKLLRALESREVQPVGASHTIPVDIRVLSATNQDIAQRIAEGRFREDLFYRLNVIPLTLPPLRERCGDIELLMHYFINLHAQKIGKAYPGVSDEVLHALINYRWPGNVRELSNLMEYLVNIVPTGEVIDSSLLPPSFHPSSMRFPDSPKMQPRRERRSGDLKSVERTLIEEALSRQSNKRLIAEELGIGVATLYRKIKKYGLDSPDNKHPPF